MLLAQSIIMLEEQNSQNIQDSVLNKSNSLLGNKLSKQDLELIISNAKSYIDEELQCLWFFVTNPSQNNRKMRPVS